jgi:hypothetical protein
MMNFNQAVNDIVDIRNIILIIFILFWLWSIWYFGNMIYYGFIKDWLKKKTRR